MKQLQPLTRSSAYPKIDLSSLRLYRKAQTEIIREAALTDFRFCFECIFYPGLQLADFHLAEWDSWREGDANLLLGYPGSAKSTVRHIAYHAWLLLRNRWELQNKLTDRPLITASGSQNLDKAKNFTGAIKKLLALPAITVLFGLCVDINASDARFDLLGVDYSREKDNAVMAFGAQSGELASIHCDILTLDDPITIEMARSVTQRQHFTDKVPLDIERALRRPPFYLFGKKREPQFNVIGYPHHSADFYAELQDEQKNPKFKDRLQSWPILTDDGLPLWAAIYPQEKVEWIKANTPPHIWLGMYMQKGAASGGDIIKDTWLRWWADNPPPEKLQVYIGGDLAVKQKEHNDYTAYFALGFDSQTRKRWELDCVYGRWSFNDRIARLKEFAARFPATSGWALQKIGIEAPASGSDVVQILKEQTDLPIYEIKTDKDKISRLIGKSHLVEQGKLILKGPSRNDNIAGVGDWPAELLSFRKDVPPPPPSHDDRTDAWLIAESLIADGDGFLGYVQAELKRIEEAKANVRKT